MLKKPWFGVLFFFLRDREHRRWEPSEIKGTNYWGKGCRYDSTSNEFKKPRSVLNSFNQSETKVSVSKSVSLKQLRFYTTEWHLCLFTFCCRLKIPYKRSPRCAKAKEAERRNRRHVQPKPRSQSPAALGRDSERRKGRNKHKRNYKKDFKP